MRRAPLGTKAPKTNAHDGDLLLGNSITPLLNGESAYPEMIAAINCAHTSISLATYRFDNDTIGRHFFDALATAVARNVKVCVLIDAVGALHLYPPISFRLRKAGIKVRHLILSNGKISSLPRRYHRRILITDGQVGFTGGMNIRDSHLVKAGYAKPNQDVHFRLEGPLVSAMQRVFLNDWSLVARESLSSADWLTQLQEQGTASARLVASGFERDVGTLEFTFRTAVRSSCERIDIVTPYFLPSESLLRELTDARRRNVKVRLFVPSENFAIVEWASCRHLERLMAAGCTVLAVSPPFDHTKLMILDSDRAIIGSANWDQRSLFLNAELICDVRDAVLTTKLAGIIKDKELRAKPVEPESLHSISRLARLAGKLAEPQL